MNSDAAPRMSVLSSLQGKSPTIKSVTKPVSGSKDAEAKKDQADDVEAETGKKDQEAKPDLASRIKETLEKAATDRLANNAFNNMPWMQQGGFPLATSSSCSSTSGVDGDSVATTNDRYSGGYVGYQPLGQADTSKVVDLDWKRERLMNAIQVYEIGTATFNGSSIDEMRRLGTRLNDGDMAKQELVDHMLEFHGNDENFMAALDRQGLDIFLADHIYGSTYVGGGVAAYYNPGGAMVFSKKSLDRYSLAHETFHARDHMVDGSLDGIMGDIPGAAYAVDVSIARMPSLMHKYSRFGYALKNGGRTEPLAVLAENYQNKHANFRKDFPEMTAIFDKALNVDAIARLKPKDRLVQKEPEPEPKLEPKLEEEEEETKKLNA